MNEKKRKISTCVYVHSILHHWVCILILEGRVIEYVCWWELVCELSKILFFLCIHFVVYIDVWGSLHWVYLLMGVCMWASRDPPFFLYSLYRVFWEWDGWPSLKRTGSLSLPSLHSLLMWLSFMLDLSWSSLFFVLFASPSFSFLLLIHHLRFTPYSCLTMTHFGFDISSASFLHISLSVWFASSSHYWYYIHIRSPQVHDLRAFLYMLHFTHEGMGFWPLGIWA